MHNENTKFVMYKKHVLYLNGVFKDKALCIKQRACLNNNVFKRDIFRKRLLHEDWLQIRNQIFD